MLFRSFAHTLRNPECKGGERTSFDGVSGQAASGRSAPEGVSELLDEIIDVPDEKILVAAAYFHAKFENIHAFADGNGRTVKTWEKQIRRAKNRSGGWAE